MTTHMPAVFRVGVKSESYLDSDGHQFVIWSFVQQDKRSSHVLLFAVDHVSGNVIQANIVRKIDITIL